MSSSAPTTTEVAAVVGPLPPFLRSAFDLNNAQIGGLTSATAVAYVPTLIFAGWPAISLVLVPFVRERGRP